MSRAYLILQFLKQLASNNDREWFATHKDSYSAALQSFTAMVDDMIRALSEFDPTVKGTDPASCIFRIYRDARFSKDKSPYKTNFGAFMLQGGKKGPGAGYYLHLQPGECFLAGGVWMPDAATLKKIRDEIVYTSPAFDRIMKSREMQKTFGPLDDISLKKVPPAYPADLPVSDYLRYKSYTVTTAFDPLKYKTDEELIRYAAGIFKTMLPFKQFLDQAANA